ncbi:MAG: hypothetical protein QM493_08180, partial [Sulfurovum sp.]
YKRATTTPKPTRTYTYQQPKTITKPTTYTYKRASTTPKRTINRNTYKAPSNTIDYTSECYKKCYKSSQNTPKPAITYTYQQPKTITKPTTYTYKRASTKPKPARTYTYQQPKPITKTNTYTYKRAPTKPKPARTYTYQQPKTNYYSYNNSNQCDKVQKSISRILKELESLGVK